MKLAMEKIMRRKEMPICILCNEETPAAHMSAVNPRICKDCWAMGDMERFVEYVPPKGGLQELLGAFDDLSKGEIDE
jgi:hypothetical protein